MSILHYNKYLIEISGYQPIANDNLPLRKPLNQPWLVLGEKTTSRSSAAANDNEIKLFRGKGRHRSDIKYRPLDYKIKQQKIKPAEMSYPVSPAEVYKDPLPLPEKREIAEKPAVEQQNLPFERRFEQVRITISMLRIPSLWGLYFQRGHCTFQKCGHSNKIFVRHRKSRKATSGEYYSRTS